MPRSPEQELVDRLGDMHEEIGDLWEMCDRTGLSTAKVQRTRYGSAGTIFTELMAELSEKVLWMMDCATDLRDEAEED